MTETPNENVRHWQTETATLPEGGKVKFTREVGKKFTLQKLAERHYRMQGVFNEVVLTDIEGVGFTLDISLPQGL